MELYTLDVGFRRDQLIDLYESLIWAERFQDIGDFELIVPAMPRYRNIFSPGVYLTHNETTRIMCVETIEQKRGEDGFSRIHITGRSYEKFLDDRVLADPVEPYWTLTAPPAWVARQMFNDICIDFILTKHSDGDYLDWVMGDGNIYPSDLIPEPVDPITVSLPPTSLYNAIRDLCVEHDLGFRFTRDGEFSRVFFNIYSGSDRTSQGGVPFPIIFSEDMESLKNVSILQTNALYKNLIWVVSDYGDRVLVGEDLVGNDRNQMVIKAEDLDDEMTEEERLEKMERQGRKMLALTKNFSAFDGEATNTKQYKYDVDYYLGDVVEVKGSSGALNYMRVTEYIFVSDANGDRSYPTLSMKLGASPGSWLAWGGNREWDDMTTEIWNSLP